MSIDPVIINDPDKAIALMHDVCIWMKKAGLVDSQWWEPDNMNPEFMLKQAEPSEFFVAMIEGQPAASVILQDNQRNQSWKYVDKTTPQPALYIHWLAVKRQFAGMGLPKTLVEFAIKKAHGKNLTFLRLDTNANQPKLMKIYRDVGFRLMAIEKEENKKTAYYQMKL